MIVNTDGSFAALLSSGQPSTSPAPAQQLWLASLISASATGIPAPHCTMALSRGYPAILGQSWQKHSDNVIIFIFAHLYKVVHFTSIFFQFSLINFLLKGTMTIKVPECMVSRSILYDGDNSSFLLPPCSGVWSLQHCSTLLMYLLVCSTGGSYPITGQ